MADRLLTASLGVLAFLLGCYELFDPDIWWHVKSGQWILEHRRVPRLDIFSYASADRAWIDLHWGFQVVLALAFRLAGVAGMILLAAAAGCASVMIAMMARAPDWPRWPAVLCWLPALALMAMRFDPRPEIFSLVFLACFLAVLVRADRHPALIWALPIFQVFWVNSHGLFVLGPIVLGCYVVERIAQPTGRPGWRPLFAVSAAVVIACFLNPYGVRGALFPLELFPKISDPANPYKTYVDEFTSLRSFVFDRMRAAPGTHPHVRAHILLLLLLPVSFVLPAAWEKWHASIKESEQSGTFNANAWAGGLVLACALVTEVVLGVPLPGTPRWLIGIGRVGPAMMLIGGACVALGLAARSRVASATLAVGTAAVAAWAEWLSSYLFNEGAMHYGLSTTALAYVGFGLGALSLVLIVRAGGSLFRLLLMASFTYLAFHAIRNINLFGLVAGAVFAWNICEWLSRLALRQPHRSAAWTPSGLVAGFVALWAVAVVTDRYYELTGDNTHFGLREKPLTFGHDAARFAGRTGLPQRALVFDLGQTGVYIYHNGPSNKVYMDARLEVPSRSTFQRYVAIEEWLNHSDPRWDSAVARLGDPLVLISHEAWAEAEASILSHPRWRCVYFDAIASVFVTRTGPSSAPTFPELDLMASHFATRPETAAFPDPKMAAAEATALFRLGIALRKRGGDFWRARLPILTRATDLTRAVLSGENRNRAPWWRLLGLIQWETVPDLTRPPPGPSEIWDPATGLPMARATYCFRRSLEARPDDEPTLRSLAESLSVRRMGDARREVELLTTRNGSGKHSLIHVIKDPATPAALPWSLADRIAVNHLHRGEPELARRTWKEATAPKSPALHETRLAEADLVAFDASAAAVQCRRALQLDPTLGEAWYVLTMAALDSGRADEARAACTAGLKRELTAAQRQALVALDRILTRFVQPSRGRD